MFTLAVFEQNGNFKDHYLLCGSLWVEAIGVVTLNEVMIVGENVNITSSVCRFKTSFDVCLYVCCTNLGFYEPKWDGRARFCVLFFLDVNNKRSQFEHLRIISCHLFSQHHGFSSTTTAYSDDWANQRWAFLLFLISNLPTDRWRLVEKFFPCTEAVLAFFSPIYSGAERGDPSLRRARECSEDGGGQRERVQRHGQDAAARAPRGNPDSTGGHQSLRVQQWGGGWEEANHIIHFTFT